MRIGVKIAAWLALSAWFGSWLLFALVVAPTAFHVLPIESAGVLAKALLPVLYVSGAVFSAILASANATLRRGIFAIVFPLVLGALAAVSQLAITPAVDQVLPTGFNAHTLADAGHRFASLHMLARGLFGVIVIALGALVCLQVRWDQRSLR